ncbi:hypothetical protein D9M73_155700 [compost metagenome]
MIASAVAHHFANRGEAARRQHQIALALGIARAICAPLPVCDAKRGEQVRVRKGRQGTARGFGHHHPSGISGDRIVAIARARGIGLRHRQDECQRVGGFVHLVFIARRGGVLVKRGKARAHRQYVAQAHGPDRFIPRFRPVARNRILHTGDPSPVDRNADQQRGDALPCRSDVVQGVGRLAVIIALTDNLPIAQDHHALQVGVLVRIEAGEHRVERPVWYRGLHRQRSGRHQHEQGR